MAISLVAAGQKWTATIANTIIAAVNAIAGPQITPTSVAGTGVSLSGAKVSISAATTASINGVFSATYDWYDVVFDLTTSGAYYITAVLRVGGTDATTAYDRQISVGENATNTTVQSLNQASWRITTTGITGRHSGTIRLFLPGSAVQTTGTVLSGGSANPMAAASGSIYTAFLSHRTLTAYDGITFVPSAGTITGTVRVSAVHSA